MFVCACVASSAQDTHTLIHGLLSTQYISFYKTIFESKVTFSSPLDALPIPRGALQLLELLSFLRSIPVPPDLAAAAGSLKDHPHVAGRSLPGSLGKARVSREDEMDAQL